MNRVYVTLEILILDIMKLACTEVSKEVTASFFRIFYIHDRKIKTIRLCLEIQLLQSA